jgi:hypothetical protein
MDDQLWQPGVEAKIDFHCEWGLPPELPPFNDETMPQDRDPIQQQSTHVGLEFMSAFDFRTPTPTGAARVPLTQTSDAEGGIEQEPVDGASTGNDSNSMESPARRYAQYLIPFL